MRNVKGSCRPSLKNCVDINRSERVLQQSCAARLPCCSTRRTIHHMIKWKEIYENLENAADRCEDVRHINRNVVLDLT